MLAFTCTDILDVVIWSWVHPSAFFQVETPGKIQLDFSNETGHGNLAVIFHLPPRCSIVWNADIIHCAEKDVLPWYKSQAHANFGISGTIVDVARLSSTVYAYWRKCWPRRRRTPIIIAIIVVLYLDAVLPTPRAAYTRNNKWWTTRWRPTCATASANEWTKKSIWQT